MLDVTVRAWKDPAFRASLSPAELAALPANPAGETWYSLGSNEVTRLVGGKDRELPPSTWGPVSNCGSCGYICTATTECPWYTLCC